MGLVEIRQGSGAYVLRRPQGMVTASVGLMLDLDHGPLDDLADLRLWLETLGAVHATGREPASAAGNAYLTALYEGVHTAVLSREYERWVRTETEPAWLTGPGAGVLLDLHQAIYDAVAGGDADAARTAVLRHHEVMLEHLAAARRP